MDVFGVKMMFDWTLSFEWFEDFNDIVPCMSGGLFAISRKWWHESGEYDYQMMMWGAENIEQSIRIWLCGGEIYVARDSRVSHVFRPTFPYKINNTEIYLNKVRSVFLMKHMLPEEVFSIRDKATGRCLEATDDS